MGNVFLSSDYTIGIKILYKSYFEYEKNKDYDISIVLSAMAFESEISILYKKWSEISSLKENKPFDEEQFEESLRRLGNIDNKIEKISEILFQNGLNAFINDSKEDYSNIIRS